MQKFYNSGSDWTPERHILFYQEPILPINSIYTVLQGPQLWIVTNIDVPYHLLVTVPTKRIGIPDRIIKACVYDVQVNKIILEKYPNLVMPPPVSL